MVISSSSPARVVLIAMVVAIIGLAAYYAGTQGQAISSKPYQAVFLSNGQVYFGKIAKQTAINTILADIYYLQVQQPIQPPPEGQQQAQTQIQLVKLGGELHKPKDEMTINNEHILFTEEIQNDGQVGQAIDRHKKGLTNEPSSNQTQQQK